MRQPCQGIEEAVNEQTEWCQGSAASLAPSSDENLSRNSVCTHMPKGLLISVSCSVHHEL